MKQWIFVQICKEVLVGDAKMADGVVFEHLKYYKEPVEGLCFLKEDRKQCFQTYSEFYDVWEVASKYPIKDYEKDQSSDTDGNNMKLIYLTDEKEMMDKLADGNDQSKLVMVAAEALNELSNPQDIIDCPEPISFFLGSLSSDDDHFEDDDSYESEDIKCNEDDDFEDEDSYESVHTQEDINKMRSGAETLQNLSKDAADSIQNNEDLRDKVNRQRNPTVAMKSPFNIRKVNILCKLNKREKSVLELIKRKNANNLVEKFFGSDLYCNVDRSYFKNLVNKTKHVTSNIIDIWAVVLNAVEKYRSPGSVLRLFFTTQAMLFCHYLKVRKHPKAQQISKCAPRRLEMEWQTSKNKTDCGIFTMRHLEFYLGVEDKQWRSIFKENGSKDELATLRKLYAAKILLSDANKYKKDIITEASKLPFTSLASSQKELCEQLSREGEEEMLVDQTGGRGREEEMLDVSIRKTLNVDATAVNQDMPLKEHSFT
ncbi:hypothetical protein CTI12_AA377280 [Artemisia annua]|uniref:Ulp1 protease family, C-terminal catalytic domain-containing protein n=1 Tax=Artemisia annua TaxID=35608 RepID=A0A2U1MII1_ARTAN|nr:hypothetical protein CTI12_AA377280 [Artemisia annua]